MNSKVKNDVNNWIFFAIVILLCLLPSLTINGQGNDASMTKYRELLHAVQNGNWKYLDKEVPKFIKAEDNGDKLILNEIVSYFHIHSVSALMNEGKLNQKQAIQKVKIYEGKSIIIPGHPFKDKCQFDCLFPMDEDRSRLFCTSSNDNKTIIYSFEYFQLDKAITDEFIKQNEGKILRIRARLKDISVEGNMLPRFRMEFDDVQMKFDDEPIDNNAEEDTAEEENGLTPHPFSDSLQTYLMHDIYINTTNSIFKKQNEFFGAEQGVQQVSFHAHSNSKLRSFSLSVVEKGKDVSIAEVSKFIDERISILAEGYKGSDFTLIKAASKLIQPEFVGLTFSMKDNSSKDLNTTMLVYHIEDDVLCEINYIITDTLGISLDEEQERSRLTDFINRIEVKEKNPAVKDRQNPFPFNRMMIGFDYTACEGLPYEKCLQVFVDNTEPYDLINVSSEEFKNTKVHSKKGFIIPYQAGSKMLLHFSDGQSTVSHPFTIPKLPE